MGNSRNLNQRFSFTSHTKEDDLRGQPQNNRHPLNLASPARGGGLHRKSVGFKTFAIACLALALISAISLNIVGAYSINNTRANALGNNNLGSSSATTSQGSAATLANDPNSIAISIANATGNPEPTSGNISITTPAGGGIATGSHTVTIHTSSIVSGYNVTLHSSGGDTDLVPSDFGTSESSNNNLIEPAGGSANPAPLANPTTLADNQWGIALPGSTIYPNKYSNTNYYTSTNQTILANTKYAAIPGKGSSDGQDNTILTKNSPANQATGDSTTIYYGVKVSPSIQAGTYHAEVTYTATATIPTPTLTKLVINDSVQVGQTSEFAIEGTNLDTIYDVWIDYNGNGKEDANEKATNVTTYPNTDKASAIISFTNPEPASNTVSPGTYDVYAVGQGGTSQPLTDAFIVQERSTCRNGDPSSDCRVDIDDNMIPIYYAGNNTDGSAIWKVANINNPGEWYDYTKKQWANAVTVQSDKLTTYQKKPGTTINNDDVLGYWVYIPRYAYEVQRPNAIDRVVADEYPLPDNVNTTGDDDSPYNKHSIRNEFSIHFEKATDTKKTPAETCNILNPAKEQMWANGRPRKEAGPDNTNILAKDYRTGCAAPGNTNGQNNTTISRLYTDANIAANNTTWATHPAFSWLDNNGNGEELNGLWIGKFETTGTVTNPTIKPNQHANVEEYIGEFYTMARSIGTGTYDPTNNGGNDISGITQNSHNLNKATSHMLKNSEWGAITYLASSKYGAGTNNVSINSAYPSKSADADIASPSSSYRWGITGCGPNNINRLTTEYSSVTTSTGQTVDLPALSRSHIEDPLACGDVDHSYIGNIGQLASTTNNVYGIYDMSGGVNEFVAGNLTGYDDKSESFQFIYTKNPIKPPYVDLYKESLGFDSTSSGDTNPAWSYSEYAYNYNNDVCTWGTCGGHALHETKQYQSSSSYNHSWGDDGSNFFSLTYRWLERGNSAYADASAGLFESNSCAGSIYKDNGFRSVLLAAP